MPVCDTSGNDLPGWLPAPVRTYLSHTETGVPLRELARRSGLHASTILRQVRRYENRRDDPLVDEALTALGRITGGHSRISQQKDRSGMTATLRKMPPLPDSTTIDTEARRILRRLNEPGAVLALSADLEKAVVLKAAGGGQMVQTAVVDRGIARAFALKEWIVCRASGRVSTYEITASGRVTLKRLLAQSGQPGFADQGTPFARQHREMAERDIHSGDGGRQRVRCNLSESPVSVLARRREKDGRPFLSPDLVAAAERLREDFELAQMGPRVAQNWERFLTAGDRGGFQPGGPREGGSTAARDRVAAALRDLGPGLGDVALRVCCFLEGVETAERRMGWAARSGKIVLRIALQRLRRHYDETYGRSGPLIG
ncbi:helix-turn-helix domain-containing protein [Aliigemmobacter aestuarii]|uniref:Helix-turn-helix domain-containing protein n=1 Tax=Aliigemmobacter aestuarii TaxID=1445661 RepID=A0A4S3MLZ0_9RHOB|nr:DUF6456 domain-containing protein [Gemmobacter aestuarii]THD83055.1 helix-turn-helix domain-containing protein [Gemmobacter aestuarii]